LNLHINFVVVLTTKKSNGSNNHKSGQKYFCSFLLLRWENGICPGLWNKNKKCTGF